MCMWLNSLTSQHFKKQYYISQHLSYIWLQQKNTLYVQQLIAVCRFLCWKRKMQPHASDRQKTTAMGYCICGFNERHDIDFQYSAISCGVQKPPVFTLLITVNAFPQSATSQTNHDGSLNWSFLWWDIYLFTNNSRKIAAPNIY